MTAPFVAQLKMVPRKDKMNRVTDGPLKLQTRLIRPRRAPVKTIVTPEPQRKVVRLFTFSGASQCSLSQPRLSLMTPDAILDTYEAVAVTWDRGRDCSLFERAHLERLLSNAPGPRVLDLGCGSGRPIAQYLVAQGRDVTGVDGSPAMIALFRRNVPSAEAVLADMRTLALGQSYDTILAWNSFFHLSPDDQRAMFPIFAAHASPGATLMFTAGPRAGEPVGEVAGKPVYHASLDPGDYGRALDGSGFKLVSYTPEDPECAGHTVYLARRA